MSRSQQKYFKAELWSAEVIRRGSKQQQWEDKHQSRRQPQPSTTARSIQVVVHNPPPPAAPECRGRQGCWWCSCLKTKTLSSDSFFCFFIREVHFNGVVRLIACVGKLIACGPGCASLDYVKQNFLGISSCHYKWCKQLAFAMKESIHKNWRTHEFYFNDTQ